jgi:hypothetical protein
MMERSDQKTSIDQMFQMNTEKISGLHGSVWKYEWEDDLGLHQYFTDGETDPGIPIKWKVVCTSRTGRIYSWEDQLGYHEHILDVDDS